ncbi:hypothetical protein VNO78_03107 [Psophocarpus tetragonolobus]|uniref:Uncharacterized protein n=1 Tax=Psophocarpus tetragonolobus TaxID=3891 RepID=A0AAN9SZW3_PSOTE
MTQNKTIKHISISHSMKILSSGKCRSAIRWVKFKCLSEHQRRFLEEEFYEEEIRSRFGFGDKWVQRIQGFLQSSFISVLVNGSVKVNFHKSSLQGVGVTHGELASFASILNCDVMQLLFSYLGIPMEANMRGSKEANGDGGSYRGKMFFGSNFRTLGMGKIRTRFSCSSRGGRGLNGGKILYWQHQQRE